MFYIAENQSECSLTLLAAAVSHSLAGSGPSGMLIVRSQVADGLGN